MKRMVATLFLIVLFLISVEVFAWGEEARKTFTEQDLSPECSKYFGAWFDC